MLPTPCRFCGGIQMVVDAPWSPDKCKILHRQNNLEDEPEKKLLINFVGDKFHPSRWWWGTGDPVCNFKYKISFLI